MGEEDLSISVQPCFPHTPSPILAHGQGDREGMGAPSGSGPFLGFLSVECPRGFQESYGLPTWVRGTLVRNRAELGTVGRGETPGTVSAGDGDSVAKGSKGWASWHHGSQTLDRLEKHRPKVTAAGTLPDTSVAFTAITHFRTWGSLGPRDRLPSTT